MELAKSTRERTSHSMEQASVDRIDSNYGYSVDNVQFVALIAQYAKHQFTGNQVIEFCRAVAKHHEQTLGSAGAQVGLQIPL